MATFLMWNIGKRHRDSIVQTAVAKKNVDILLLVEFHPSRSGSTLSTLLLNNGLVRLNTSERFGVFGRSTFSFSSSPVPPRLGGRVEVWNWAAPGRQEGRFLLVHGLDRQYNDDGTRRIFFNRIAEMTQQIEQNTHRRTIVVGDFNAHPFESSVVSSDGLHAIGVRQVHGSTSRLIRWGETREEFYYNPMWRHYGHDAAREAGVGTHYWYNNLSGDLFWHMLDQVVLRPEECGRFDESSLQVLVDIDGTQLLTPQGTLDTSVGSDHLPLMFNWTI